MVDAAGEVCVRCAADGEVPFEHVVFEGGGMVLVGGVDGEFADVSFDAAEGGGFAHGSDVL